MPEVEPIRALADPDEWLEREHLRYEPAVLPEGPVDEERGHGGADHHAALIREGVFAAHERKARDHADSADDGEGFADGLRNAILCARGQDRDECADQQGEGARVRAVVDARGIVRGIVEERHLDGGDGGQDQQEDREVPALAQLAAELEHAEERHGQH